MTGKIEIIAKGDDGIEANFSLRHVGINEKANIMKIVMDGLKLDYTAAILLIMAIKDHEDEEKKGKADVSK